MPLPPVKVSIEPNPLVLPVPERISFPSPPIKLSFLEPPVRVSLPNPPLRVTAPRVKAEALIVLLPMPPVRVAVSILVKVSVPKPVRVVCFRVKLTSPDSITVSVARNPLRISLPSPPMRVSFPSPPSKLSFPVVLG